VEKKAVRIEKRKERKAWGKKSGKIEKGKGAKMEGTGGEEKGKERKEER
jgi:hypothetical protein